MNENLLTLAEVLALPTVPFKKAALYAAMKAGRFPAPIRFGPRMVRWKRADLDEWARELGVGDDPRPSGRAKKKGEQKT